MNRDQQLGYCMGMIDVCAAIVALMSSRPDLHGTSIDRQLGELVDSFTAKVRQTVKD